MNRPRYLRADRAPTWTSRVMDALRSRDDFLTADDLRSLTGASRNQLAAALHHLMERAHAVSRLEEEGQRYYFLTGEYALVRQVEERVPESPGSRARRKQQPCSCPH